MLLEIPIFNLVLIFPITASLVSYESGSPFMFL